MAHHDQLLEPGDMDSRLIELWRSRPEDLRHAIRRSREAYHRAPKAAGRLPAAEYLVGESKGGPVLFGAVIADQCSTAEFEAAFKQATRFVEENRGGLTAARKAGKKKRQLVRLEVFLPPDFVPETPATIEGVPVEWFKWVPVNENEVRVEKLAVAQGKPSTGAGGGVIAKLLGHLAWWEQALRNGTGSETPYRKTLLVYNAATLLEWHFTAPGKDPREHFQNAKTREKAGKVIGEFVEAVRACVEKTEGVTGAKAEKQLAKLAKAIAKAVKNLAKLYQCSADSSRYSEFEKPLKPAALISAWLAANAGGAPGARGGVRGVALYGAGDLVLQSLVPALAAEQLFDEGKLTAEGYTAVRQTCAEFLEDAVAIAAKEFKGRTKKQWQEVGRPTVEALRKPVAPFSGKGES
jgi:hypothetical protein